MSVIMPDHFKSSFSATLENVDKAVDEIKTFLKERSMDEHVFDVVLLAREGLTNAVRHGCRVDGSKQVHYGLRLQEGSLILEIEDEGEGFDWRSLACCLDKVHDSRDDCGRGLAIMHSYSTDMRYNERGNALILRKKIS
ncbi:MAG: ATP-binding protein [Syntrophobacteraceae bacterium]